MKNETPPLNYWRLINYLSVIGIFAIMISCGSKPSESEQSTSQDSVATQPAAPVSARPTHWGYDGADGPTAWASLDPVYALCGEGKGQSPINIEKKSVKGDAKWNFNYKTTSLRIAHNEHMDDILDNGHTIQVTVDEGSVFDFGGKSYDLKQFHFHTPSEHTVDGKHLPMEMHMVHQSADKSLAVVSILFEEVKLPNENLAKIVSNLPSAKGESKHITDVNLELKMHLPKDNDAYHYIGSLTTPPCSESVQWLVLRNLAPASADQVTAFSSLIGSNNRPVQALNDRTIEEGNLSGEIN
jgi:carbonic anhydrase